MKTNKKEEWLVQGRYFGGEFYDQSHFASHDEAKKYVDGALRQDPERTCIEFRIAKLEEVE